ncbi:MAG TPA: TetR/AcrR family transcriptional regulator [Thermomicrobiales bacterium]|nr:TetR/AcrR family transcriptional regulator [Thermomicrobiales bacterium]
MVTSGERTRERNPQGEGARLRDELIAAAGRLLARDGDVDALSLRGVAREAGVAAPSVYLHFASKEDLLRAVIGAHFAALQHAIETEVASGHDPASRLLSGCLAYCRYAVEQPGSYQLLFNTPRPDIKDSGFAGTPGAAAFQTLVDGVAACIAAGAARPGDPFRVATDIWSALHGTASLRRATTGFPWPPLEDQVRGILEAFTGTPYRVRSTTEEISDDGAA